MISSPSTLPQPSHEGDEGQSAGRKTFRPPGPKKALSRVSDAEQQLVARYVDRDTACDDAQPGRTAEPRVMFEQPGGLICDSIIVAGYPSSLNEFSLCTFRDKITSALE